MKYTFTLLVLFLLIGVANAKEKKEQAWKNVAVIDGREIYIDTLSVVKNGATTKAVFKEVFVEEDSRQKYLSKLEKSMSTTPSDKKQWDEKWSKKWADVKSSLSTRVFDCANDEYQILEVTDCDSLGKAIQKIKTSPKNARWNKVEPNTVGKCMAFYLCGM